MILYYPFTTPSITVTLPNPKLGDVLRQDTGAIIRESRAGEPKSYRDAAWGTITTTVYAFETLTRTQLNSFESFLIASAADEIGITDQHGREWRGFILSSSPELITMRDDCAYDVSFEFLGDVQ